MTRRRTIVARSLRSGDPVLVTASVTLAALLLAAALGRVVPGLSDTTTTLGPRLAPPSVEFWLGTDTLGRNLFNRLLEGIGTTLMLSAAAVVVTAVFATALGIIAAYFGSWVREVVMRLGDVLYAFPALLLAILLAATIGPGTPATLVSIVLITLPLMTRMVAASAARVMRRDFVTSAKISGVAAPVIMWRHVLRNVSGTVAIQATYALSVAILVEGGLSFIGYGVQLPASSLGLLAAEGAVYMTRSPWMLFSAIAVLVVAILSITLLGDSLRDRLEPREAAELT